MSSNKSCCSYSVEENHLSNHCPNNTCCVYGVKKNHNTNNCPKYDYESENERSESDSNSENGIMSPETFRIKMLRDSHHDPETSHRELDYIMCDLLRSLGYGEGVDIFLNMKRWYA